MTYVDWFFIALILIGVAGVLWTWKHDDSQESDSHDIAYRVGEDAMVESYDPTGKVVFVLRYKKNEHWRVPHVGDRLFIAWGDAGYRYSVMARRCLAPGQMTVMCKLEVE